MFPFPIATPQGCDIQTFYGNGIGTSVQKSWNKPVGVSHVYMMLIGAGGNGTGTGTGGGSGAVTVWYGAAQHVPNIFRITFGTSATAVLPMFNLSSILTANNGSGATAGTASTAGPFAASGFYQSVAGQDGSSSSITASTTTFLSGGKPNTGSAVANYGYTFNSGTSRADGFFMLQPIIVGMGGQDDNNGGLGCGGGANGIGGNGMVLIASW